MDQEFHTLSGGRFLNVDCDTYDVRLNLSQDENDYQSIVYTHKITKNQKMLPATFYICKHKAEEGEKLEIRHRDQWGSEMIFIHYAPSDLKGMFNFIGRGYQVFDTNFTNFINNSNFNP